MASNQSQQIESLFHAAVKLPSQARVAFLAEACAGDADLRREVEALLAADVSSESATLRATRRATVSAAIYKSVGAEVAFAQFLAMTAEAFCCAGQVEAALTTIDEALAMTSRNRDCYYDAELHRWRGELLLLNGATKAEAETCFQQAIEIARQQSAKSWELRASTSLARLWQRQGKSAQARQMLAEIYGWFTEGFDTADLQDAQRLLQTFS